MVIDSQKVLVYHIWKKAYINFTLYNIWYSIEAQVCIYIGRRGYEDYVGFQ